MNIRRFLSRQPLPLAETATFVVVMIWVFAFG